MKPKKMWTEKRYFSTPHCWVEVRKSTLNDLPVLVVPLDAESVEELREKVGQSLLANPDTWTTSDDPAIPAELIEIILAAIGITSPKKKRP